MRDLLVCPKCKGSLTWTDSGASCETCHLVFQVEREVPVLVVELDNDKRRQAKFHDEELDSEEEIERPHCWPPLAQRLMERKLELSVAHLGDLTGRTVLAVCGGSGMDAEFLVGRGARVISADISLENCLCAMERARRRGLPISAIVADAEQLPLPDRSVDVAYVLEGLHHLRDPLRGMVELARVARDAVSINEPMRAALTRLSVMLGVSQKVEPSGNVAARVDPRLIREELRRVGFERQHQTRYALFYRRRLNRALAVASKGPILPLATQALRLVNGALGPVGNKVSIQALRSFEHGSVFERP